MINYTCCFTNLTSGISTDGPIFQALTDEDAWEEVLLSTERIGENWLVGPGRWRVELYRLENGDRTEIGWITRLSIPASSTLYFAS